HVRGRPGSNHPRQGQTGPPSHGGEPDALSGIPPVPFRTLTALWAFFLGVAHTNWSVSTLIGIPTGWHHNRETQRRQRNTGHEPMPCRRGEVGPARVSKGPGAALRAGASTGAAREIGTMKTMLNALCLVALAVLSGTARAE